MVDSHTIAAGTVTLMGVSLFIRSISGVINATSNLIQAACRLFKNLSRPNFLDFFKKPSCPHIVEVEACSLFKKPIRVTTLVTFKKNSLHHIL